MQMRVTLGLLAAFMLFIVGCSEQRNKEQEAERSLIGARDLEEELDTLPQAITRYGEIAQKYSGTPSAEKAQKRQEALEQVQSLMADRTQVPADSLQSLYESAVPVLPDYLAVLKRLGTIYFNQTHLAAPASVKTGLPVMKNEVLNTWHKQDKLWSAYAFRPIPADRLWQDRLCTQAIEVTQMLVSDPFRDYDDGLAVINRGLAYAKGEDVKAQAKIYKAYCLFWHGKKEDFEKGIDLVQEALKYEFLPDDYRARGYHAMGLCYAYLYQDSHELADLDAAIKALNECVNIDSSQTAARELLKGLREQREKVPNAS